MQKYPVPPLGIRRVRSQTGKMKISLRALLLATLTTNAVALPSPLDITVTGSTK